MSVTAEYLNELASKIMLELRVLTHFEKAKHLDKKELSKFHEILSRSYDWEQRFKQMKEE